MFKRMSMFSKVVFWSVLIVGLIVLKFGLIANDKPANTTVTWTAKEHWGN